MTSAECDLILKESLRDEHNLRIAVKVGSAFQALKNRIWHDFLHDLEARVLEKLGAGWKTRVKLKDELSLSLRKDSWPLDKWMGLRSEHPSSGTQYY
jgi:hypothetical protein